MLFQTLLQFFAVYIGEDVNRSDWEIFARMEL